jgi:adenine-specific DNA-methyltransferase
VRINDSLHSAVISAGARLISHDQVTFKKLGGYSGAVSKLNAVKPLHDFMWRTYSPASIDTCGIERRYFTEENAAKIDAMRCLIVEWKGAGYIDEIEERLLIADLFSALNRVANIAGTFGCFLSNGQANLKTRLPCVAVISKKLECVLRLAWVMFDVPNVAHDLVYLDPRTPSVNTRAITTS